MCNVLTIRYSAATCKEKFNLNQDIVNQKAILKSLCVLCIGEKHCSTRAQSIASLNFVLP